MVDSKKIEDWFNMAKKDFNGAKILYEHGGDYYLICFHCQQAIEKYLKGYLISKTGVINEGHSLVKLCKEAQKYNENFKNFLKDCALVNSYYIETRYPAEEPLYVEKEEVLECMRITEEIMNFIDKLVQEKN
ncbi:HEPN domain-containing protein [Thermoanaerobacter uzonensis DSM 18761]|uniref:HEPN domain-containing protein n=1 Tax=Thermoanaerobacter uzonensis DSM 18761 TaxID=1123369 RepID=A0A1M4SKH6_9THEO|nr:HEPN domain-containing protein [Thermoanaerobacter uzonensis]SHE32679.1 HEPN domain-containing protein [Thermoanaerobacter uzonensis DSM 18761]